MYAYALTEDPRDGARYGIGDELPDDLPGLEAIVADGWAGEDPPPASDPAASPTVLVLEPDTVEGLTKRTRDELEAKGILPRHLTAGDAGEGADHR